MKKFLIVITTVAVLTVDCRNFTDQPGKSVDDDTDHKQEKITMSEAERAQGHDSSELQVVKENKKFGLQRTDCKMKRVCAALGGFCIVDAMEGCGGRLIPEYCAGSSCSCCIPDNQCVVEDGNNSILWHKIDSSVNEGYDNVTGVMETIIQNLTIELHSMEEHQGVMEKKIQNQTIELHSMEELLIQRISQLDSKIQNLIDHQEHCPVDFFKIGSKCYKIYHDKRRTWDAAKVKCADEGYVMAARPDYANTLRNYIDEYFGKPADNTLHLRARGDGSVIRWVDTDDYIRDTDALWVPHYPGNRVTTSHCLVLVVAYNYIGPYPTHPYTAWGCTDTRWTLCEYPN